MTDVETVARAIMIAKGGACNVTDWAERYRNLAVMEVWFSATAALAAATPLIEARPREECARVAENYGPSRPREHADRDSRLITGRWEGEQAASANIAAAIRKGRP